MSVFPATKPVPPSVRLPLLWKEDVAETAAIFGTICRNAPTRSSDICSEPDEASLGTTTSNEVPFTATFSMATE